MATRNELEQEALKHTKRGNYSKAARIYHAILRQQPRDRRIRQKLGETYLKMGQKKEGAKYMREVAGLAQREGQHRVAISIYRQLAQLLEDDLEIVGALAESYRQNNQLHEANRIYEKALNLAKGTRAWDQAVEYAMALSKMKPSDMALRFTLAELREASGDLDGALADYRNMAAVFQRRGEMGEVARVAEAALRMNEEEQPDPLFLAMAIKARVDTGDFDRALELAKPVADELDDQPPELTEALAIALQKRGEESKARRLFLDIAVRYRDVGDSEGQARALGLALESGSDDPKLREAMAQARARAERLKRKLGDEPVLSPTSDEELAICVRAEVQARYGFLDRALSTLNEGAKRFSQSYAVGARRVEVMLEAGQKDEATQLLERLVRGASGSARQVLAARLLILGGPDLMGVEPEPAPEVEHDAELELVDEDEELLSEEELLEDEELLSDEELVTDESLEEGDDGGWAAATPEDLDESDPLEGLDDGPLGRAEALVAEGDLEGAIEAFQEAFRDDPLNDEILMRIAEVRRQMRQSREPAPPPEPAAPLPTAVADEAGGQGEDDDLADLGFSTRKSLSTADSGSAPIAGIGQPKGEASPSSLSGRWKDLLGGGKSKPEPDDDAEGPSLVDVETVDVQTAWALAAVERYQQALDQARGFTGLAGRWLESRCLAGLGDNQRALEVLRDALEEASERDPVYPEALHLMTMLQVRAGRHRAALRVARELEGDFPSFRPEEIAALIRGLQLLR